MMQPELMLRTDYDNPQQNLHNPPLTKQYQKSYWTTELSTNKSEKAAQFYP